MIGDYTHPSMPGTPYMDPAVFLSAALEDAEGHALVSAIHDTNNPRLRNTHTASEITVN